MSEPKEILEEARGACRHWWLPEWVSARQAYSYRCRLCGVVQASVSLHADPDPIRDDLWCDQCGEAIAVGCILADPDPSPETIKAIRAIIVAAHKRFHDV